MEEAKDIRLLQKDWYSLLKKKIKANVPPETSMEDIEIFCNPENDGLEKMRKEGMTPDQAFYDWMDLNRDRL